MEINRESLKRLRLVCHPIRVKIIIELMKNALHSKAIAEIVSESPQLVSHHLTTLEREGLLWCTTTGRYRYFRVNEKLITDDMMYVFETLFPKEGVDDGKVKRPSE